MGIDVSRDGKVATVTINRPEKLNALSIAMYEDLGRAFNELRDDEAIDVIILTGAGPKSFCVGADLTEVVPALARDEARISDWDDAHIKGVPIYKPVIAAVNGLCFGGGVEMMLATDIRVVATNAVFGLPEPRHGIVPAGGTLVRLVRQIGYAQAMEILLTGDSFSPEHFYRVGIVNQIVAPDQLMDAAREWARRLMANSAQALRTIKEAALTLQNLSFKDAFAQEALLGRRTFLSADARNGLAAFASRSSRTKGGH